MRGLVVLALDRNGIANYVAALFRVYGLLIIAYIVTSLFFAFGGRIPYSRWSRAILDFLRDVSEPLLRPFRAILPTLGPLDLSPIVALIVLQIVGQIVVNVIRG
ncbi:MAG: YggT family protein [Actinobacteria bacterium]|nr:MAG: YggT family protein [Actinomycetota bacterium]